MALFSTLGNQYHASAGLEFNVTLCLSHFILNPVMSAGSGDNRSITYTYSLIFSVMFTIVFSNIQPMLKELTVADWEIRRHDRRLRERGSCYSTRPNLNRVKFNVSWP